MDHAVLVGRLHASRDLPRDMKRLVERQRPLLQSCGKRPPSTSSKTRYRAPSTSSRPNCVAIGERLWFGLQAQVKVIPVTNAEELGKGLSGLSKIIEHYA